MEGVLLLRLLQYLSQLGFEENQIWRGDAKRLKKIKSNLGLATKDELEEAWSTGIELTDLPYLGLVLGEDVGFESLGLLGLIIRNSSSVGELTDYVTKNLKFVTSAINLKLDKGEEKFTFEIGLDPTDSLHYPNSAQQGCLVTLAFCFRMFFQLTNRQLNVDQVIMPNAFEQYSSSIIDFIPAPFSFSNATSVVIVGDLEILDTLVVNSDRGLLKLLLNYATKRFAGKTNLWSKRVELEIINNQASTTLNIEEVASNLGIGVRKLQRKLKDEQTTYSEIKDNVRVTLINLGKLEKKNSKTLAANLGFSSSASFSRFLKRNNEK